MADTAKKTETLKIRVDPQQKADLEWAAKKRGLELSAWIRWLVLEEADRMKKNLGRPVKR